MCMNEEQTIKLMEKLNDISERIVKIETLMQEWSTDTKEIRQLLKEHERRIAELENHKSATVGAKDIIAWVAIAGIMVWEVLSK